MRREDEDTQVSPVRALPAQPLGGEAAYLVVMSGRAVGRMHRVARSGMVIGRSSQADVVLDDDGVSRNHARIDLINGTPHLIDMDSTNGTFVEGERVGIDPVPLRDGDRVRVGPVTILKYGLQDTVEHQFLSKLYRSATRDGLTSVYNKRFFLDQLDQEFAWHRRHDQPLTLILIDLDHFKQVNDTFGHLAGDDVLVAVAKVLDSGCRTEDLLARFGGEEFSVILRQTTVREAQAIAERLRSSIGSYAFRVDGRPVTLTASLGVVTRRGADLTTPEQLLQEVDDLLYRAKSEGRNRVVSHP